MSTTIFSKKLILNIFHFVGALLAGIYTGMILTSLGIDYVNFTYDGIVDYPLLIIGIIMLIAVLWMLYDVNKRLKKLRSLV